MSDTFDTALAEINERILTLQNQRYILAKGVRSLAESASGLPDGNGRAALRLARNILGEDEND